MLKFNKFLLVLIGLAIITLIGIGVYEIFFKPPEEEVNTDVNQISTYFGEDVLQAISK